MAFQLMREREQIYLALHDETESPVPCLQLANGSELLISGWHLRYMTARRLLFSQGRKHLIFALLSLAGD